MNWYIAAWKKLFVFKGRARRKEYWYFVLFNFLIYIGLAIIDSAIGTFSAEAKMGLLSGVYAIAVIPPYIAVGVRRLHDINRTGWWLWLGLIPLIGAIVLIVFFVKDSDPGENNYGANPKAS